MENDHQWKTPPTGEVCVGCFKVLESPAIRINELRLGIVVGAEWFCSEKCYDRVAYQDFLGGAGDW